MAQSLCTRVIGCIVMCAAPSIPGQITTVPEVVLVAPHVKVVYQGVTEAQAHSIAETVSTAWEIFDSEFKPVLQQVQVNVNLGPRVELRFAQGSQVLFTVTRAEDLRSPGHTRIHHVYGFCHELGHLVMLSGFPQADRSLTAEGFQGWAHYSGAVVTDILFQRKGPTLWWDPYDFRAEGVTRLTRLMATPNPPGEVRAASAWMELEPLIGRQGLYRLFAEWRKAATTDIVPAATLKAVLLATFPNNAPRLSDWWDRAAPCLTPSAQAQTHRIAPQ